MIYQYTNFIALVPLNGHASRLERITPRFHNRLTRVTPRLSLIIGNVEGLMDSRPRGGRGGDNASVDTCISTVFFFVCMNGD